MLRQTGLLSASSKAAFLVLALLAPGLVGAQDDVASEQERASAEAALRGQGPFLQNMSKEDYDRAVKLGREVVGGLTSAYELRDKNVDAANTAQAVKQRKFADSIANDALQAERDKALDFLGLDPQSNNGLFIFLSWSMPLDMLRSYVLDGMWSGATLVFRGIPPKKELGEFITKDLQSLVYGKSAAANISIDPRFFDAYKVTVVPTIVFTTVRDAMACQGVNPVSFEYASRQLSYDACPALDEDLYWKMAGAVSTKYALDAFEEAGAAQVKAHQRSLARGFQTGHVPSKSQSPFAGKWESVLSPADSAALLEKGKTNDLSPRLVNPTDFAVPVTRQGTLLGLVPAPAGASAPAEQ